MEKFIIMGGNPLSGSITISGSKNSVLPILAASLLSDDISVIRDVPKLLDVRVMKEVLEFLGCNVDWSGSIMKIDGSKVKSIEISDMLMRKMRASNLVMGPLLARFGCVRISYPGGCAIGSRPMDLHLQGLKKMGAIIEEKFGFISAVAKSGRLKGTDICLDFPSVGATENLMMAATLAKGKTIISNAAKEPEIHDLQCFLNSMGAKVKGGGTDVITVVGVDQLHAVDHTVIPDRIEAGTFLIAGAVTKSDIQIKNLQTKHLESLISKLKEMDVHLEEIEDGMRVKGNKKLKAVDIKTMPYPGFPTDLQPQMMALLCSARGTSIISENIFENRYKHINELRRMGANITAEGKLAIVKGAEGRLSGALVSTTDLRAGAALVIAGLAAQDVTIIDEIHHIDRGYENFEQKLRDLGAKIIRISEETV